MKRLLALSLAASFALSATAFAAPTRVRGTLVSSTATAVTVRTLNGDTDTIALTPKTRYVAVSKASLADVQAGKYIGTATKDVGGQQIALEVAIFPESMRGRGEGHYPWDNITDTTGPTPGPVSTSMTNGSVAATMPPRMTASSMTNGNVQTSTDAAGDKTLVVTYKGGTQTILVPPSAPIVMLAPADNSVLRPGASVIVVSQTNAGQMSAVAVSVGQDGLKLPM